jgi:DNA-binding transcriptional regulator GbsR (MarR family)
MVHSGDSAGPMTPLSFDLAKAELLVDWLPRPDKEFRSARSRWINFVRSLNMLTGAERQVGLAIAQLHINRQPGHPWFNWAWPSHQTLANETGLSRRTVVSAVKRLAEVGLIRIAHKGGRKGRGGRTDRYTLRVDRIELLEAKAAALGPGKGVKKVHLIQSGQTSENEESGEICDRKVRNPLQEDVKGLPTTLTNTQESNSVTEFPTSSVLAARKQAGNGSKKSADVVTSSDHTSLALCLGDGDLEVGYERLQILAADDVDVFALRLRKEPNQARSIRLELNVRFWRRWLETS